VTAVRRESVSGTDAGAIRDGLVELLDQYRERPDDGSRVLVVPDAHYPYHPSTGLVTNPDVVDELVGLLDRSTAIGIPASEHVDAERAGRHLGYERLADRNGIPVVDLDAADRVTRRARFVRGSAAIDVPEPVLDDEVVVVPTPCRSRRYGVAAGAVTLARTVATVPTRREILASIRVCWPTLSVLDGTFAYADEPRRTETLLASGDVVALSRAAADLVDVDWRETPHLASKRTRPPGLRSSGTLVTERGPDEDGGVMAAGYRLYAKLTGDLVPPQMLLREDNE